MKKNSFFIVKTTLTILAFFITTSLVNITHALPVTTGLVGYWAGEGNADDTSGQGNHGTLQGGTTYTTGVIGQAFSFDGVNDWISTSQTFANDQSHTISAWIYWRGETGSNFQEIVGWWNPSISPVSSRMFLGTAKNSSGQGPVRYGDGWNSANAGLQVNEWVHILATYDGSNNNRNIYLNGVLADSLSNSVEAHFFNLSIGRQGTLNGEYWNGNIDELALFDRVLNTNEITALASISAVPVPPALWMFCLGLLSLLGKSKRES